MANAEQRANFYDYLALVNANAVRRTSWWDYLPTEIQIYIIQFALRQHHRDQLADVHQVIQHFWSLCNRKPFDMLCEIRFFNKTIYFCGQDHFLRKRNQAILQKSKNR